MTAVSELRSGGNIDDLVTEPGAVDMQAVEDSMFAAASVGEHVAVVSGGCK